MRFLEYLENSIALANEEKEILDELSKKGSLNKIELRAAKNSLQVLIENAIGKAKKILKHYNCPIIPQRSRDAFYILREVGAISEEEFKELISAIGFRNVLIHDYLEFDNNVVYKILSSKKWVKVYEFIIKEPRYNDIIIKRLENFSF